MKYLAKIVLLILTLLLTLAGEAQTFTGTIVGRVLDAQDAAVANASVTLINLEKEFERHALTNERGEYTFELVPPGRYRVRAESAGFAPIEVTVEAVVATPVRADLVLRIKQVHEELKVIGEGGVSVQTVPGRACLIPQMGTAPRPGVAFSPQLHISPKYFGITMPPEVPMKEHERAYTSPIWYTLSK